MARFLNIFLRNNAMRDMMGSLRKEAELILLESVMTQKNFPHFEKKLTIYNERMRRFK
jgi:hypothetical protein